MEIFPGLLCQVVVEVLLALNDLSDVSISSLSSGQVLKYNGTNWVNDTDNTGSGGGGSGGLPSGVSYSGSGASAEFVVTGNIRATADITAYHSSDRRFKDNLTRIRSLTQMKRLKR